MNAYDVIDWCTVALLMVALCAAIRAGAAEERKDLALAIGLLLVAGLVAYSAGEVANTNYRPGCVHACRLDHDRLTEPRP